MGFSNQERININSKALQASVINADPVAQWYETRSAFAFLLDGSKVLIQLGSIPVAGSLAVAQANATANPILISDLSAVGSAIRLTAVPGTNGSTFLAHSVYGDTSSAVLDNWIQPQMIPQSSGAASIGYAAILFDGDPAGAGVEVTTTDGTTGTGATKTVGWIWNYALAMLLLSDDFASSVSNPYIMGFRYTGKTANDADTDSSLLTADETLAIGDVVRIAQNGEVGLTAGRAVKAISSSEVGSEVVGVATSAATQGNGVFVATDGEIAVTFGSAPATTSNGQKVFLSSTSGQATLTAPGSGNTIVQLGILIGANGADTTVAVLLEIKILITID